MTKPLSGDLQFFFGTLPQPCPYLPNRLESKIVTELSGDAPETCTKNSAARVFGAAMTSPTSRLYRLSGLHSGSRTGRRIKSSRSLRRVWRRNADLIARETPARGTAEQYAVFARYQQWRHGDGGMATMNLGDYRSMVEDTPIETTLVGISS